MTDDDLGSVWIKSEPDMDGTYHLYLELGTDDVIPLERATAEGWVRSIMSAVAVAQYDAAVFKQLTSITKDRHGAALMLQELREDRASYLPMEMVPGLRLVPGVSAFTGKGFLRLERHEKTLGQWEITDAKTHALAILEALSVLDLDGAFYRLLVRHDIGRDRAMHAIGSLADYRNDD